MDGTKTVTIRCHMGNKADIEACINGDHPHCERVRHEQAMKASSELGRRMRMSVEANVSKVLREGWLSEAPI